MSDVLIIAGETQATRRVREALELEGYAVATAPNLIAALPKLYLSPCAMRVILGGELEGCCAEDALRLVAADPGPLGRHGYTALEAELSVEAP